MRNSGGNISYEQYDVLSICNREGIWGDAVLLWLFFALIGCACVYLQFLFQDDDRLVQIIRYWSFIYGSFLGWVLGEVIPYPFGKRRGIGRETVDNKEPRE